MAYYTAFIHSQKVADILMKIYRISMKQLFGFKLLLIINVHDNLIGTRPTLSSVDDRNIILPLAKDFFPDSLLVTVALRTNFSNFHGLKEWNLPLITARLRNPSYCNTLTRSFWRKNSDQNRQRLAQDYLLNKEIQILKSG